MSLQGTGKRGKTWQAGSKSGAHMRLDQFSINFLSFSVLPDLYLLYECSACNHITIPFVPLTCSAKAGAFNLHRAVALGGGFSFGGVCVPFALVLPGALGACVGSPGGFPS